MAIFFILFISKSVKQTIPFSWSCQDETVQELCCPVYSLVKQLLNNTYILYAAESFLRSQQALS
jgi:hypothetical protein